MNSSHKDANVSLGLNIVEGCMTANRMFGRKPLGLDITPENIDKMLGCSFMLAHTLRNSGVRGLYYELAPIYMQYTAEHHEYPDAVRIFHLLPKYVDRHTKTGEWPVPTVIKDAKLRAKMMNWYYHEQIDFECCGPLSYVPDIDEYWLTDTGPNSVIDVFKLLHFQIAEILMDAENGYPWFELPTNPTHVERWLRMNYEAKKFHVPAICFLLCFFPYRMSLFHMERGTEVVNWIWDNFRADAATGSSMELVNMNHMAFLKYGPECIRRWVKEVCK